MRTKSPASKSVQTQLWKVLLTDLVDPKQELVLLAKAIDWSRFEAVMEPAYSPDNGRPSCPLRMLAGLPLLRVRYGLNDQEVRISIQNKSEYLSAMIPCGCATTSP